MPGGWKSKLEGLRDTAMKKLIHPTSDNKGGEVRAGTCKTMSTRVYVKLKDNAPAIVGYIGALNATEVSTRDSSTKRYEPAWKINLMIF
jgi:hypothetical protein